MRALLGGELAQAQDYYSDYYVKLEVQNGSGTWIDVGAALGKSWIVNATWGEAVDTPVSQATFTLVQQIGTASLSPLIVASPLNVNDVGAYAPLLNVGRLVRASTATMAHLVTLDVSKYRQIFTGRIDNVEEADTPGGWPGPITIRCSDLGGWLMDLQIETSGIQYGTTPVGTALETVLQNVINANIPTGEPAVTLYKQSSSSFAVTEWRQGDTKLLEALTTLVLESTGEDLRYRYDAAHASRLTWFNPDRARVSVDATFAPKQYVLRQLDIALANIRNAGEMPYVGGVATATSATSIANFRRRFFRMASSTMITTLVDAQKVIDAVVNDLSAPPGEAAADCPYLWFVQLYDRYTFQANARQFDSDQTFGVLGYQHTIENGRGQTTLTLTARIVGAFAAWLNRIVFPVAPPQLLDFDWTDSPTARTITFTRTPGTTAVWVYDNLVAVGGGSGWPQGSALPNGSPAILLVGTDSYVALIPPAGYQRFVQLEPRTDEGVVGDVRRTVVDAAPVGITYNQAFAQVTASDATTITVTVTATAASGSPTVQLVGVTGSATLLSGPAVNVPAPSGTAWVFTRGAALGGSGQAQFRAVYAGNQSDDDFVEIPEQGRDTVYLASRARVTATTATTVTVRYAVADPYPPGGASVTVAYQDQGSGGVSPSSGGTITPAATLTEAAGTYIDYTITRPAFSAGTARVTFTATAAGRVSDSDAVDVPAQERDTVPLAVRARVTATAATTVTVRVAVADPFPQGAASGTITYQDQGSGGVTPASGGTVTPAATLSEAAGTYIDYVITRPAFSVGTARVTFTATATSRVSGTDAVDVPAVERDTTYLASRARVTATTATTVTVRYAVADPYPQGAASATITYQDQGSGGVSPSSGGTVTPAATLTEAAGTYIDYTITRPAFGVGAGRVTFTATAANRVTDSDAVDVPEVDRDTVSLRLSATQIASTATTIDVQLTPVDPLGTATMTVTLTDAGSPAVTNSSLGSNQWRLTRPAWNTTSSRVEFTVTATGRASAVAQITVPPQTSQSTASKIVTIGGDTVQPIDDLQAYAKGAGHIRNAFGAGTTFGGIISLAIADGVTITGFNSTSYRSGATGSAVTVIFTKQAKTSGTTTALATHSNNTTATRQLIQTTGLSEVVDNTTYTYYVDVTLLADTVAPAGSAYSELDEMSYVYTSPTLAKSQ